MQSTEQQQAAEGETLPIHYPDGSLYPRPLLVDTDVYEWARHIRWYLDAEQGPYTHIGFLPDRSRAWEFVSRPKPEGLRLWRVPLFTILGLCPCCEPLTGREIEQLKGGALLAQALYGTQSGTP